jgi:hypothetical protein
VKIVVELLGEQRGIAPGSLARRLVNVIATDHLVQPILDDENEPRGPRAGEHPYSETRGLRCD